jgi:hypothetical protein
MFNLLTATSNKVAGSLYSHAFLAGAELSTISNSLLTIEVDVSPPLDTMLALLVPLSLSRHGLGSSPTLRQNPSHLSQAIPMRPNSLPTSRKQLPKEQLRTTAKPPGFLLLVHWVAVVAVPWISVYVLVFRLKMYSNGI